MATSKKSSGKKSSKKAAAQALATRGNCLSLSRAGIIVQDAIPGGPHPIDLTLEGVGLISENQRTVFREDVFNSVLDAGCNIQRSEIPNGATNTIREVRDGIKDAAS